jgi:hypothetical protein
LSDYKFSGVSRGLRVAEKDANTLSDRGCEAGALRALKGDADDNGATLAKGLVGMKRVDIAVRLARGSFLRVSGSVHFFLAHNKIFIVRVGWS